MTLVKKKIVIGITGASGSVYAKSLLQKLNTIAEQIELCNVIFSEYGEAVWKHELGEEKIEDIPFKIYNNKDFFAPFASGSAGFDTMIIIPCTMGTMGRIASGIADDLISRAADVMLKERRKLILVTREMPLNLIHINNMKAITEAGGIICPASPSFYSLPSSIDEIVQTVSNRVLDLAGFDIDSYRWST